MFGLTHKNPDVYYFRVMLGEDMTVIAVRPDEIGVNVFGQSDPLLELNVRSFQDPNARPNFNSLAPLDLWLNGTFCW